MASKSIKKLEIERFSLTSSHPFDAVVAALKAGVGRLDLAAFAQASHSAGAFSELEKVIGRDIRVFEQTTSTNDVMEKLARDGVKEFTFIALPLKIQGGTGSPIRPVAVI